MDVKQTIYQKLKNMNKTEKEEIAEMLDEYWNDEDPNIDTVAIAGRIMLQLGKMIGYKRKR